MNQFNDQDVDQYWMRKALRLARLAMQADEVPVGALIVKNNKLVSVGLNLKEKKQSPLAHAELISIDRASKKLNNWRLLDCTLYVTLEPCPMCAGALLQSRIKRVVFGLPDPKFGALKSLFQMGSDKRFNHTFEIINPVLLEQSLFLMQSFFSKKRRQKTSGIKEPFL